MPIQPIKLGTSNNLENHNAISSCLASLSVGWKAPKHFEFLLSLPLKSTGDLHKTHFSEIHSTIPLTKCKALALTGHLGFSEQNPEKISVLKCSYLDYFFSVSSLKRFLNTHTQKIVEQSLQVKFSKKDGSEQIGKTRQKYEALYTTLFLLSISSKVSPCFQAIF